MRKRLRGLEDPGVKWVAQLQTVFFDFVLEGAAADAEKLGCLCSILVGFI